MRPSEKADMRVDCLSYYIYEYYFIHDTIYGMCEERQSFFNKFHLETDTPRNLL